MDLRVWGGQTNEPPVRCHIINDTCGGDCGVRASRRGRLTVGQRSLCKRSNSLFFKGYFAGWWIMVFIYNLKPNQTKPKAHKGALASRAGYGVEILGNAPASGSWQTWFSVCFAFTRNISIFVLTLLDSVHWCIYFFFFLFFSPQPVLVRCNWHKALLQIKMYSMMILHCEIITKFPNKFSSHYHLIQIWKKKKREKSFFSLVIRTLGTDSLNFEIYHTAVLAPVPMLYIVSLALIYLITGSFTFWPPSSHSSSPWTPAVYEVVLALSLKGQTEVYESEKVWPKPFMQRNSCRKTWRAVVFEELLRWVPEDAWARERRWGCEGWQGADDEVGWHIKGSGFYCVVMDKPWRNFAFQLYEWFVYWCSKGRMTKLQEKENKA